MGDWFPPMTVIFTIFLLLGVTVWLEVKRKSHETEKFTARESRQKEIVAKVNEAQSLWKARFNKFSVDYEEANRFLNENPTPPRVYNNAMKLINNNYNNFTVRYLTWLNNQQVNLPPQFDAREQWTNCSTIHRILDQGGCGSCWAVASTSVMSDRICIHSNGTLNPEISVTDLISCCNNCGGCMGSYSAVPAFHYWKEDGIVTGGPHGSFEGCKPYSISSECGHPCSTKYFSARFTPTCQKQCQSSYSKNYKNDRHYGGNYYALNLERLVGYKPNLTVDYDMHELTKKELFLNGPIVACFTVYEDFQHYASGIYSRVYKSRGFAGIGDHIYGHCTRLLGWGEEKGTPFWILANSWGRSWGEHGFYRVHGDLLPKGLTAALPSFVTIDLLE